MKGLRQEHHILVKSEDPGDQYICLWFISKIRLNEPIRINFHGNKCEATIYIKIQAR